MKASLVRGKWVIARALDRHRCEQIEDGAVLQRDGVIAAVGPFAELQRANPEVPVVGSGEEVLLPGFINAHHHIGLSPIQLGISDTTLELWFATSIAMRDRLLYWDTLYAALEMVAAGTTTVQNLHGWIPGDRQQTEAEAASIIRAYEDIGMRVSYCYALREQNHLVYEENDRFLERVPASSRPLLAKYFSGFRMPAAETIALFEQLFAEHRGKDRVKIQLAPSNQQWCSDEGLTLLAKTAEKYGVPVHVHLLETPYQKEYAKRRGNGATAVDYLERFGLLGPQTTLGHAVWLTENDIDKLAATGTSVCHNISSNLRLRSGIMPLNRLEERGVNTAIGLDDVGINDDQDILQEMRLVLRVHREPGMDDRVPTIPQVFRMATSGGAKTTPWGTAIGTLEPGKAADMVLLDWRQVAYPYLDAETPVLDAVIQRAKMGGVRTVMVAGEILYKDGRFTRVDRDAALRTISEILKRPLSAEEDERRLLAPAIYPWVKGFYDGYLDINALQPFYRQNSLR
ncbi:MAG TPA: amidohydrolase family protein [Stellaceae bacterium]|nr:amidohydrolase family protein [Stellaceae bacterium]